MSDTVRQVLLADDRRRAALVAADADALGALLAPDLHYVHTNAALDDRQSLLRKVADGTLRYQAIDVWNTHVDDFGTVAVQHSQVRITVSVAGTVKFLDCRTLAVWKTGSGSPVMRHYQTTAIAPPPTAS